MPTEPRTIIAIRTHKWDEDAQRIYAQLSPGLGDQLVVVFHNRPKDLVLPLPVVDIDDGWLAANRLRRLSDWGWRCGDYFLYAARAAYPKADFIWMIEPDVFFTDEPADFFDRVSAHSHDLLGVKVTDMPLDHRFARGLPGLDLKKSIFALTRFSGRAADRLFALRQDYGTRDISPRFYTNDELFCFSNGFADKDMTIGNLSDLVPDWFAKGQMAGDPDILIDALQGHSARGIFHPVRGRDSFCRAVAQRMTTRMGYLGAMQASLALLSNDDRRRIATDVGNRSLDALNAAARNKGVQE